MGLTVLLIVVVLVTVGVSVASRSVSELKTTRLEEESTRSLNIAESGLEKILDKVGTVYMPGPETSQTVGSQTFKYTIVSENVITNMTLTSGHALEVMLNNNGSVPNLIVTWPSTCPNAAAIEITLIKNDGTISNRYGYDPCSRGNNFTQDSDGNVNVTTTAADVMARIKAFYATTTVSVSGDGAGLPSQVYIVSTNAPVGADNTTRAVQVKKIAGSLPSIFDYVLFSGTNIVK